MYLHLNTLQQFLFEGGQGDPANYEGNMTDGQGSLGGQTGGQGGQGDWDKDSSSVDTVDDDEEENDEENKGDRRDGKDSKIKVDEILSLLYGRESGVISCFLSICTQAEGL